MPERMKFLNIWSVNLLIRLPIEYFDESDCEILISISDSVFNTILLFSTHHVDHSIAVFIRY